MDLPSIDEINSRIAAVERENRVLKAELADIRQNGIRKIVPPAPIEPTVRVSNPIAVVQSDMPDSKELQQLRDICAAAYPLWTDSEGFVFGRTGTISSEQNDREYLAQLGAAILAISHLHVLDKPDPRRYVSAHVDAATAKLRAIGRHTSELRASCLCMAALVMAVPISGLGLSGASISIGLSEYSGRPVDPSRWRETLRNGKLPAQFPVDRPVPQSSRVEVMSFRESN